MSTFQPRLPRRFIRIMLRDFLLWSQEKRTMARDILISDFTQCFFRRWHKHVLWFPMIFPQHLMISLWFPMIFPIIVVGECAIWNSTILLGIVTSISSKNQEMYSHPGVFVGVSQSRGTPKSSSLVGFSILHHPAIGVATFYESSISNFQQTPH